MSATNVTRAGKRGNICGGNNVSATMCPRLPVPLARSVDARSVNSPQVKKFLPVYHCSGDQGSTKVIIFYAILVC